jgi:hypothetical protein
MPMRRKKVTFDRNGEAAQIRCTIREIRATAEYPRDIRGFRLIVLLNELARSACAALRAA